MTKRKPKITLESFGRYSKWEKTNRKLPKILEFTNIIEAVEGNEFGLIMKIEGGKGIKLDYTIRHPSFKNEAGLTEPDFMGEYYVTSNQHEFYVGDCIGLPVEDKVGLWEINVCCNEKIIISKKFQIIIPE